MKRRVLKKLLPEPGSSKTRRFIPRSLPYEPCHSERSASGVKNLHELYNNYLQYVFIGNAALGGLSLYTFPDKIS
jgi:hypothetical protein